MCCAPSHYSWTQFGSGEWWKSDTEAVINEALKSGSAPNVSDAHTINGHPGSVQNCASQGKVQKPNSSFNVTRPCQCHSTIEINNLSSVAIAKPKEKKWKTKK